MNLNPTTLLKKRGLSTSTSDVDDMKDGLLATSMGLSIPSAPNLQPARFSTSNFSTTSVNWAVAGRRTHQLENRPAVYDSFITVKNNLRGNSRMEENQQASGQNVSRSRSFVITKEKPLQKSGSEEIDLDDETASITDVRLNIRREGSFARGVASPSLTAPRSPYGSISYVAWDDAASTAAGIIPNSPLKIWSEDSLLQFGQTAYHDENISQILDFLYIGDIHAANNEYLLCRLSIDAIIDMSNLRPEDLRKIKACHIPCTCPMSSNHQRAKLIIAVRNHESEDIQIFFDEINRFIESIRRSGRKVLVHCKSGQGRAAVAVIQYLMQIHGLTMNSAFRVAKLARMLKINPVFRETLEFLESRLRNEGKLPPLQSPKRLAPRPH